MRLVRWLPFPALAFLSVWVAAAAPEGRKPFSLNLDISPSTLAHVAVKPIHFRATAVLCLLAILAVGHRRLLSAFALTLFVAFAWELAQATVVGHNARLADMLPNIIGAGGTTGIFAAASRLWWQPRLRDRQKTGFSEVR